MGPGSKLTSGREKRARMADSSKPSATKRSISGDQSARAEQGKNRRTVKNKTDRILGLRLPGMKTIALLLSCSLSTDLKRQPTSATQNLGRWDGYRTNQRTPEIFMLKICQNEKKNAKSERTRYIRFPVLKTPLNLMEYGLEPRFDQFKKRLPTSGRWSNCFHWCRRIWHPPYREEVPPDLWP